MPGDGASTHSFLVVGCGSIGKRHIRNLITLGARDIRVLDPRPDRLDEVRSLSTIPLIVDARKAWDPVPDAVIIATPTRFHLEPAVTASHLGCHLFIEKPISHTLDGLDELLAEARRKRLVTLVGCNMRFHPGLAHVKRLVDERIAGRIVAARVSFGQYLPDWHPQEDYRQGYSARSGLGGGVILDAIHEIDYIRWILGEVKEVTCFAGRLSRLQIDTEDMAAMILKFKNSAFGEVHLDYVERVYSRACRIIGDEGTIAWDYSEGRTSWYTASSGTWESVGTPPGWEANHMYLEEMGHFIDCLDGLAKPQQDLWSATEALKVALAARKSAREGRVVRLDEEFPIGTEGKYGS